MAASDKSILQLIIPKSINKIAKNNCRDPSDIPIIEHILPALLLLMDDFLYLSGSFSKAISPLLAYIIPGIPSPIARKGMRGNIKIGKIRKTHARPEPKETEQTPNTNEVSEYGRVSNDLSFLSISFFMLI